MKQFVAWLILLGIVGIIVAIAILLGRLYKKKLNRQLTEDRETLAAGGIPTGAGRHGSERWGILSVVLIVLGVIFILCFFFHSELQELQQEMRNSESRLSNEMASVYSELAELQREQKKAKSNFASFEVRETEEGLNEETMTVRREAVILLKETGEDTSVSLLFGGVTYPLERNGSTFSTVLDLPVFTEKGSVDSVTVLITSGGKVISEVLEESDTAVFPDIGDLFAVNWWNYFPHFGLASGGGTYRMKDGSFSVDQKMDFYIDGEKEKVQKCCLQVRDGDWVLWEDDLTEWLSAENGSNFISEYELKGQWDNIRSDVYLVSVTTDSRGYTVTVKIEGFTETDSGQYRSKYSVTSPAGIVLYEN